MQYREQQINNSFRKVEEQQELNFINWQLSNSTKKSFYLPKCRNQGISEWIQPLAPKFPSKKTHLISLLANKNNKKNGYSYALEALNQEQGQKFYKYDSKAAFYSLKREVSKGTSPKRINLKLPMPHFLQIDKDNKQAQYHQSSLPIIKKLTIPIRNLRNSDKKKEKGEVDLIGYRLLLKQNDKEDTTTQSQYKGRMLGTTRRILKNSNPYPRAERQSLNCSELQGCITFRK